MKKIRFQSLACLSILLIAAFFTSLVLAGADPRERGKPTPEQILNAIHQVESNGAINNVPDGDGGQAKGPLQCHYAAWHDATHRDIYNRHGEVIAYKRVHPGDYEDVKDLNYSKQVVTWYSDRYTTGAIKNGDYETVARLWKGGPSGPDNPGRNTLAYVKKVEHVLYPSA